MQKLLNIDCPAEIDHLVNGNVCNIWDDWFGGGDTNHHTSSTTNNKYDTKNLQTQVSPAQELHEGGQAISIGGAPSDDLTQNVTIENPKGFEQLLGGFNKVVDFAGSAHSGVLDVLGSQAKQQGAIASELNKSQTGRDIESIIKQLAVPVLVGVVGLLIANATKKRKTA